MTILRETIRWGRMKNEPRRTNPLTPEEMVFAKYALRTVRASYGSAERLGEVLGMSRTTIAQAAGKGRVSPELAFRIATVAGVRLGDILTGKWPKPRICPTCGQPARDVGR